MKYRKYDTTTMSDAELWQCVLTPTEDRMPTALKQFLVECKTEFDNRESKLYPIIT